MSRKNPVPVREVHICKRLRAFREDLGISRAKFAVKLGIGSERLTSYEFARVPVRFDVFVALSKNYHLDPYWLATGQGEMHSQAFIEGGLFEGRAGNELFSTVYDSVLARGFDPVGRAFTQKAEHIIRDVCHLLQHKQEMLLVLGDSPELRDDLETCASVLSKELGATKRALKKKRGKK